MTKKIVQRANKIAKGLGILDDDTTPGDAVMSLKSYMDGAYIHHLAQKDVIGSHVYAIMHVYTAIAAGAEKDAVLSPLGETPVALAFQEADLFYQTIDAISDAASECEDIGTLMFAMRVAHADAVGLAKIVGASVGDMMTPLRLLEAAGGLDHDKLDNFIDNLYDATKKALDGMPDSTTHKSDIEEKFRDASEYNGDDITKLCMLAINAIFLINLYGVEIDIPFIIENVKEGKDDIVLDEIFGDKSLEFLEKLFDE